MVSYPGSHGQVVEKHSYGAPMNIEEASALDEFEVIERVDDSNPYPALLGIN